ncbi:MAG: protein kinase domain-containing protein [Blastocatellia bacterium]
MIGRTIGNYQIISELAHGGMGTVYRGQHLHLPREVVVKSILLGAFSPSAQAHLRARFRREAFIQSQLDHPNTVRVYEFFAAEDNYFLVMEYVQGMNLRDLLARQGVPSPAQAIYLLKQALAALDYAHKFSYLDESEHRHTGIIHRDIKPANILLDTKGRLKITDFGIVKVLDEQTNMGMTQSGFHPGTVEYMSPEQLLGLAIDVRSDIYSLGVTFYEMLTGRLPFERSTTGSDWDIRKGHIELDPPSLLEFRPEIDPALAAIIMRSLRKSLNERYQSAADFLEALQNYERQHAVNEQSLQSPLIKPTQTQAMKPTVVDETATLPARPPFASQVPSPPAKSLLEDAPTISLVERVTPSAPVVVPLTDVQPPAPTAQAGPTQPKRRWPLAVGGVGLLLVGTATGAILFSRQKDRDNKTEQAPLLVAATKPEAATPTPEPAPTATIRAVAKPKPSPSFAENNALRQARALEQQERYDEAIKVYEDYLARNPNAADAGLVNGRIAELKKFQGLMAAARVAMNAGRYGLARQQYILALQLRSTSQLAQNGLAEVEAKIPKAPTRAAPGRWFEPRPPLRDDKMPPPPRNPRLLKRFPRPTPTPPKPDQ